MIKKFVLGLFAFLFLFIPNASAQEKIENFDVILTAEQNGVIKIEESIDYYFGGGKRHGIFRNIPLISSVGDLFRIIEIDFNEIKRDGEREKFSVDQGTDQTTVKIGGPDKTISGLHNYVIIYSVKNGIGSNYRDHDEIYWNITGNGWQVPITSASALIKTDFGLNPGQTICFTGPAGSTEQNCTVEEVEGGKKVILTKPLNTYEGLTIVSSFPVGTFPKSILQRDKPSLDSDTKGFLIILGIIYGILNLILAPFLIFWYLKKKRKQRFGKVSVNFDMPEYPKGKRITPAEAGTIDNTILDKDDIVATIFDLAIRKYIKIESVKENLKFRPDIEDYKLVKLKDFSDLNKFEKDLMDIMFVGSDTADLKDSKLTYTDFINLEKENFITLIERGFYTKNPKAQMGALLVFGIIAVITLNLFLGIVLIFLSRKLNGRTAIGDEMDWKTDGLKLFLKNMSRNYSWQAKNFYFVEKMIPYAMALGFINEYMEQLKILKPDYHPTWYSGRGNFYAVYPIFASSMNSNITTSAPKSSSGFSGGGSSGGGGGGGGGGSW